jgi:hypothetical protein
MDATPNLPCIDSNSSTAMSVLIPHSTGTAIKDRLAYELRDFAERSGVAPSVSREQSIRRRPKRRPVQTDFEELRQHEAFDGAQRVATGCITADDQVWLSKAFTAFLAADGSLPLERCLGLPRNYYALRRAGRDRWLRRAWTSLNDLSPWRRSEKLAAAIRDFRSRQWVRWHTLDDAPAHASKLEAALFRAFQSSEHIPSTAMQLHNIAYHRRHS